MDLCRFEGNESFFEVSEEVLSLIVENLEKPISFDKVTVVNLQDKQFLSNVHEGVYRRQ